MKRLSEKMRESIISEIYDRIEEKRRIDSSFYYRGNIYKILLNNDEIYILMNNDSFFIMRIDDELKMEMNR